MTDIKWSDSAGLAGGFDMAMRRIHEAGKKVRGTSSDYFLRGIENQGAVAYAKELLARPDTSDGFKSLQQHGRLDLTVEHLALNPTFRPLFTAREHEIAQRRLDEAQIVD